jgi:hypothetical protein
MPTAPGAGVVVGGTDVGVGVTVGVGAGEDVVVGTLLGAAVGVSGRCVGVAAAKLAVDSGIGVASRDEPEATAVAGTTARPAATSAVTIGPAGCRTASDEEPGPGSIDADAASSTDDALMPDTSTMRVASSEDARTKWRAAFRAALL